MVSGLDAYAIDHLGHSKFVGLRERGSKSTLVEHDVIVKSVTVTPSRSLLLLAKLGCTHLVPNLCTEFGLL